MPATNPDTLLQPCYQCLGMSMADALLLGLWSAISDSLDPVLDFILRAGITDQGQIDAVKALYDSAIAHGWWDKCDFIYPFVGGTALAHSQNLKSSSYTITWTGAVTHNANGITGDGATGYGATGYVQFTGPLWSLNSAHQGMYRRTDGTVNNGVYLGTAPSGGPVSQLQRTTIPSQTRTTINSGVDFVVSATALGFTVGTRTDAANLHLMTGGVDNFAAAASLAIPNLQTFVLATSSGLAVNSFSNANLAFATAGAGLTFAEYGVMVQDIQVFQSTLGRQV